MINTFTDERQVDEEKLAKGPISHVTPRCPNRCGRSVLSQAWGVVGGWSMTAASRGPPDGRLTNNLSIMAGRPRSGPPGQPAAAP